MNPRPSPSFVLVAALVAACATAPPPEAAPDSGRPFIKLANREAALEVRWAEPAPSPAYRQQVERALSRALETRYRVPMPHHGEVGAFEDLRADRLLPLVEAGTDDVVVVEVRPGPSGGLAAEASVLVLETAHIRHRIELPAARGPDGGPPEPGRLADLVAVRLAEVWTNPGGAPLMQPIAVADRLADAGACAAANRLYDRVLPGVRPGTITALSTVTAARARHERCQKAVALERRLAEERTARFEVRLETSEVSDRIAAAMKAALPHSGLTETLRGLTHKPVTVVAVPGHLVLRMRYHPERYRAAVATSPRYVQGQPVMYLEPFLPAVSALLDLRARTLERLPPYAQPMFSKFHTTLRLEKLPSDHLDLDFAELDGRILFTRSVRVRQGDSEVDVPALNPDVSRTREVVLGAPESASGALTAAGQVLRFLEIEP